MSTSPASRATREPQPADVYVRALEALNEGGVPYLVGGAYALACFAGIVRHTKDLDLFVLPEDLDRVLATLARAGFRTEVTYPHWLGKAHWGKEFLDVIFSSGNAVATVDAGWFDRAPHEDLLGIPIRLTPPEEMIWSKAFVMERERYDGADILHLIDAVDLDWDLLVQRFGDHWRVLLAHAVMYGFVYPGRRRRIPSRIMRELLARVDAECDAPAPDGRLCNGSLLSRVQYWPDVSMRGYFDALVQPFGPLPVEDPRVNAEAPARPEDVWEPFDLRAVMVADNSVTHLFPTTEPTTPIERRAVGARPNPESHTTRGGSHGRRARNGANRRGR